MEGSRNGLKHLKESARHLWDCTSLTIDSNKFSDPNKFYTYKFLHYTNMAPIYVFMNLKNGIVGAAAGDILNAPMRRPLREGGTIVLRNCHRCLPRRL